MKAQFNSMAPIVNASPVHRNTIRMMIGGDTSHLRWQLVLGKQHIESVLQETVGTNASAAEHQAMKLNNVSPDDLSGFDAG
jgi:hypothetical protein